MVGGYSFERSKFNRATQALRQVGSAFKPIVYTAAIDRGYTPAIDPDRRAGELLRRRRASRPTRRMNYDQQVRGADHAAPRARAVAQRPGGRADGAARPEAGHRLRAAARASTSPLPPYLSVALGAAEATLIEMTSAYSVFPNQGVRMQPYSVLKVTDREGNVLEENRPEPQDAIRADTAFVMTNLLRGVVAARHRGEGRGAQLAARRQDRHDRRLHRRVVHRLRSGHHRRRVGRLRPEEADRPRRDRRRGGAADLDGHHEGLDRRPQGAAEVRAARQHRLHAGRPGTGAPPPTATPGAITRSVHRRHAARAREHSSRQCSRV